MRREGFSLIELVVVISVISLLLLILVPVVGRIRDECNLVICKSNLRSLGMSCLLYSGEHNSALPVGRKLDNPHGDLIKILGDGKYMEEEKLYYCPSELREELCFSESNYEDGRISYFYYSFTDRPANRYLSNFFLKSIRWPRKLSDSMTGDTWVFSDSWFSNMPTSHRWYAKGVNYVTIDNSVHMVKSGPRRYFR